MLGGSDSSVKPENLALWLKDRFGLGKDYLLVWFGRTVSIIGDTIGGMAISLLILDRTGSATALSLGMVANLIPPLILGPVAGVILDRTDRKKVMMICDAVRGILTLVLGFVLLTGKFTLAHGYVWLLLNSIFRAFYDPASMAVIPALVPPDLIQRANAMEITGRDIGMILGPVVAGLAYASLGAWWCIVINAVTFFLAVVCLGLARLQYEERKILRGRITLSEMGEGFLFFKEVRPAMYLLLITVMCNFLMIPSGLALQVHVLKTLQGDSRFLGAASSAAAVASLLASLVILARKKWPHLGYMMGTGIMGIGLGYMLTAATRSLANVPLTWAISGLMGPVLQVPISTLYQEMTPADIRGRVFALRGALATSLAPVSVLGGGILIDRFGSWRVLYGLGWLIMGAGLSVFMVPELRKAFGPKDR